MGFRKEHKTPEEKKKILDETLAAIRKLAEGGAQGNITLPLYDGIIGRMKFELWCEPLDAKAMFNFRGEGNVSDKLA